MGAAIWTAVVATVAVTRTEDYLAVNAGANPLLALTEGFQAAFLAAAALAGLGVALALLLLGPPRGIARTTGAGPCDRGRRVERALFERQMTWRTR